MGETLGPLRFVAAWLLNSGSLPLSVIIGMIGFGLLGAVISTFVRERIAAAQGDASGATASAPQVFVSDLTAVVLRGLSAAVVVFLAVQGGLAVFAGGNSDPNPYVLLLTCLVAAVFSEKVWARAYDYLAEKLQEKVQESPKPGAPAAAGAAQGAPVEGASVQAGETAAPPPAGLKVP